MALMSSLAATSDPVALKFGLLPGACNPYIPWLSAQLLVSIPHLSHHSHVGFMVLCGGSGGQNFGPAF